MNFNLNDKLKYALVIFVNYLLVLYAYITYRSGIYATITYIPLQIGLAVLNYRSSKRIRSLIFLCVNFIIATVLANYLSMRLYYFRVRSDWEADLLGLVAVAAGFVIAVVFSLVLIIIKAIRVRKNKKEAPQ